MSLTSEVTDTIWRKYGLSFFFVTVRPSLTNACDLAVLDAADINVFYTPKRPFVTMKLGKRTFFFADNENSSYKLSVVKDNLSPVKKLRRNLFWI